MNFLMIFILISQSFSSTQSGLWSNPATWGGGGFPNGNGHTVTINSGHSVVYDRDSTNLSVTTGFGAITINGTLRFNNDTWIKVAANITGSGNFIVGTPDTAKTNVTIVINGNFSNQIVNAQYYGADRTGNLFGYLTQNYNTGATQIQVDRDMDIRVGDVICIGAGTVTGQTGDAGNPLGRGMYSVTAYNSGNRTITISPALAGNNRLAGDVVAVLTRDIKIIQASKSGSNLRYNNDKNNQIYRNCWFNNFGGTGVIGGSGHQLVSCSGSNNTNGGICANFSSSTLSGTFTSCNNTNGGIANGGTNNTLSGTFLCCNNIHAVCYGGNNFVLSGTFVVFNNGGSGVCGIGNNHILSGNFTSSNNAVALCSGGSGHILSGNFVTSNSSSSGVFNVCFGLILTGTFNCSESYPVFFAGYYYISGTFTNSKGILYRALECASPWIQTIWLNYNGAGQHRVFAYAGIIDQVGDSLRMTLEDTATFLIYEFPVWTRNGTIRFQQKVKKSASLTYLPYIELIDLGKNDSMRLPGSNALAADTMTNSINVWETLDIEKTGLTPNKKYYIRIVARGMGNVQVWWSGMYIDEIEAQNSYWGFWTRTK